MKALTVWQPWASLIAIGAKKIETRSWATNYRGPLAIHAALKRPPRQGDLPWEVFTAITGAITKAYGHWRFDWDNIPLGAVVATCQLTECCAIKEDGLYRLDPDKIEHPIWYAPLPEEPEISFGDYAPGRFAWILEDVRRLPEPIPAKGHQRLWNWEPPEGVLIA